MNSQRMRNLYQSISMTHVSSIDADIYQSPKAFLVLVIRPSWVVLRTTNYGFEYTPDSNFLEVKISGNSPIDNTFEKE